MQETGSVLEMFTNRYEFIRLFGEYLNDETPRNTILFFHGDGGNGKSLLLKLLRKKYCKLFPPAIWEQIKIKSDWELANYIEESTENYVQVPAVIHDFGQPPIGDEQPQDPFYGFLMLQRNLARYHLRFPLYSYACIWYLYQTGKLEKAKQLLPAEEMDLLSFFVDSVSQTPWASLAKATFNVLAKQIAQYWGQQLTLRFQRRRLSKDEVERIHAMEAQTELIEELPRLFAADLNATMEQPKAPPRVVLFFDTYEAFWGKQRDLEGQQFFYPDEWVRRLLISLNLKSGIVVVVAGRDQPNWTDAPKDTKIPTQLLDQQLVWYLSVDDAKIYLKNGKIEDKILWDSLINYASVVPNHVHPFLMSLATQAVIKANQQGVSLNPDDFRRIPPTKSIVNELIEDSYKQVINQILKYVNRHIRYAVYVLSACRYFDFQLYRKLGKALDFDATKPAFEILISFPFVWQEEQREEGWYRIHELVRRLDYDERSKAIKRNTHIVLEQHYREKGELAEAIYHTICQDWQRGVDEWIEVFNTELDRNNYELCRTLLTIRTELSLKWAEFPNL